MKRFAGIVRKVAVWLAWIVPTFFIVAALGTKFGIWDWKVGLLILARQWGAKLLLVALVVSTVSLVLSLFAKSPRGFLVSLIALLVPVLGIGYGKAVGKKARALPFIHDITTDTADVPSFSPTILSMRKGLNGVEYAGAVDPVSKKPLAEAQADGYPDIKPLVLEIAPDAAYEKALRAVQKLGWKIVTKDEASGIVEATDTTFWFGFKDDIVIRIRKNGEIGSKVDIRSVSRVGKSDIGANAARIRKFIKNMEKPTQE